MEETLSLRAHGQRVRDKNYNDDHPHQPGGNTRSMIHAELDDLFARKLSIAPSIGE